MHGKRAPHNLEEAFGCLERRVSQGSLYFVVRVVLRATSSWSIEWGCIFWRSVRAMLIMTAR
jgi:hypothetical protein